jgi:hypothetical protein
MKLGGKRAIDKSRGTRGERKSQLLGMGNFLDSFSSQKSWINSLLLQPTHQVGSMFKNFFSAPSLVKEKSCPE